MNAMEFMNDEYASLDVTYYLNGLLFNRIPLLKKLKWREVLSCRGLYGNLSDKNNPAFQQDLFRFPAGSTTMGHTPYVEAGVGIENIFKVLRVDYVWRLTYRNLPDVDKSGLRISLHMTLIPVPVFAWISNMFSCVPFPPVGWAAAILLALTMIPVDLIRKAVVGRK